MNDIEKLDMIRLITELDRFILYATFGNDIINMVVEMRKELEEKVRGRGCILLYRHQHSGDVANIIEKGSHSMSGLIKGKTFG